MPIGALRAEAYGEAQHNPKATGSKSHGTHSTASAAGGGEPIGHNPAHDIKHPNYCPNCGEPMLTRPQSPAHGAAQIAYPPTDPGEDSEDPTEEASESAAEEASEDAGEKEMSGHPGFGSRKRTKGTKLRKGK